ncbi:MAG: class I SAM-dependent methyltransferase [Candidatus Thermoplasmatota archaeon]|nr:class I SAM-dependent methyltransferase [Candidatus Thermoplasmatota archaeon]
MTSGSDDFARFERESWQRVAPHYEDAWSGLTRPFIPPLLKDVGVTSGTRLLDVACGPGYAAREARGLGADPMGVDFSAEMVRLARERNPEIEFRQGDAQALEMDDSSFDAVVMNFGVLHLPDPEAAFSEAHRVLRSGGRYGFTVWARPAESPGARIVEEAIEAHADRDVALPQGPDYFGYGDPETSGRILGERGFDRVSLGFRTVTVDWQVPTASYVFECERDFGVRTGALLALQTPEALAAIQAQIEESVQAYARGDGFALPYTAHVVTATAR